MRRPLLEKLVSVRMSDDEYQKYLLAAAQAGLTLSEYLRLRLESVGEDQVANQIAQLRLTLLDNPSTDLGQPQPLLLEVLLLLRASLAPAALRATHAELKRQGLTPWSAPPYQGRTDHE